MKREHRAGLIAAAVIGLTGAGMGVAAASAPPVTAGQVVDALAPAASLGAATYVFADFGVAAEGRQVGAVLPATGLTGRGVTASVLRMTDRSSTMAGRVPSDDTDEANPLDLVLVAGAAPTLRGFTLQGSPQGHLYNGVRISRTRGARITEVRVAAIPGDYHISPGQTFGISDWQGDGNVYTDVEVDGAGVGASGIGITDSADVTVRRAQVHDNPFGAGIAVRQTTGVTLIDVRTARNRTGLSLERVGGDVVITRPVFHDIAAHDLFVSSDLAATARITIADPVLAIGARLRVKLPAKQLGTPNTQRRGDLTVTRNGVDVTGSVVQWV
jgi:hypothetical protein